MTGLLLLLAAPAAVLVLLRWYRRTDPRNVYDEASHAYVTRTRLTYPRDH